MFDECVGRGIKSSKSTTTNGTMFAVDVLCCNASSRLSILMHIEFISAHVSAFKHTHTHTQAKPGYYVNIVWLKSCVLHNWLHTLKTYTLTLALTSHANTVSILSFPLSCHTGWLEYWIHWEHYWVPTHAQSFTLSFVLGHLDVMFGANLLRRCASVC